MAALVVVSVFMHVPFVINFYYALGDKGKAAKNSFGEHIFSIIYLEIPFIIFIFAKKIG